MARPLTKQPQRALGWYDPSDTGGVIGQRKGSSEGLRVAGGKRDTSKVAIPGQLRQILLRKCPG